MGRKKKKKQIIRPVVKINGDGQLSLLGSVIESNEKRAETAHVDEIGRPVVLDDPDPRGLIIGNLRLDEFLEIIGCTEVKTIRTLLRSLSWDPFIASYKGGGRSPYHPAIYTGIILFGIMQGKTALRELELLAKTDVRIWWITGGAAPSYSSIGRFITMHRKQLTGAFFEELTRKVLVETKSTATVVAGDGTVIQAVASRYKTLQREAAKEAAEAAQAEAQANPDDEGAQAKAEKANELHMIAEERASERKAKGRDPDKTRVSPTEPEAVYQKKKDGSVAPAYKASACANSDRIITAIEVHPSNEPVVVPDMLEQTERITGEPVNKGLLDAGYFTTLVILYALSKDIDLLCPQGKSTGNGSWNKKSDKQIPKNQFIYDEKADVYRCPGGRALERLYRYKGNDTNEGYVVYCSKDCSGCPLLSKCTKKGTVRKVKRYDGDEAKEALIFVMQQAGARKEYRNRQAYIEPVFSELRYIQGLNRFRRRGLVAVKLEFALHAMAHNLRRLIAIQLRRGGDPCCGGLPPSFLAYLLAIYWLRMVYKGFWAKIWLLWAVASLGLSSTPLGPDGLA